MSSGVLCWGVLPLSVTYFQVLLNEGLIWIIQANNVFFYTPGMRSAMIFTPLILSTSCIHQRGRVSLTAGWMCWDIFSRYKATVKHPTNSVRWQIYAQVSFLQGGAPSPFDRNYGTKVGVRAIQWLSQKMTENFRQGRVLVSAYTEPTQTTAEFNLRVFYPSRPRVCQLARHSVCAWPLQESHLLHPRHWTKSGDGFWVSQLWII